MHFTGLITSILAVTAAAAPSAVTQKRADTSPNVSPEQIVFAVQADGCSVLSCAAVIASAGCIAAGLATGEIPGVLGCVAGGASQLCKCAPCVDALEDFLNKNGLCNS